MSTPVDYLDFVMSAPPTIVELETIRVSHAALSKVYMIAINAFDGFNGYDENGGLLSFEYYPCTIKRSGIQDALDYSIDITLYGSEVISEELAKIDSSPLYYLEKMQVIHEIWRSDNTIAPLFSSVLEVDSVAFTPNTATFKAVARKVNQNATGETYLLDRFEGLRGFM